MTAAAVAQVGAARSVTCQACINREAELSSVHESTLDDARRVYLERGGKYPAFMYRVHTCGGD